MDSKRIEEKIIAIEAEMKRMGFWQAEPLPESAYVIKEAFAADTMTYVQWLQFIFIPRVKELLQTDGPWSEESEVGVYAVQPGVLTSQNSLTKVYPLIELLREFDDLFTQKK